MTKKEGLVTLDALKQSLEGGYATLQELYESVHHPVANDIQDKTDEIMKRSIDIAVMALNFKEIPQDAKRPFAALVLGTKKALLFYKLIPHVWHANQIALTS